MRYIYEERKCIYSASKFRIGNLTQYGDSYLVNPRDILGVV